MVKVKICGLTNPEDAARSCEHGADYLGFIFVEGTPREVDAGVVHRIVETLPRDVGKVGLFKDETVEKIVETVLFCGLDHVQLHGEESPEYCGELKEAFVRQGTSISVIKALKVSDKIMGAPPQEYIHADYFVFDTFRSDISGGTGSGFDWNVLIREKDRIERPFFLAGGLDPANVADAIRSVEPYGVDVSSGVERTPGKKDENLLKEFIENAKKA